jgi:hypothetical protein
MENRARIFSRSRHSCRGRTRELIALLAAGALLVGCTTTHTLGRIDDPGVRAEVDAVAANGDAIMHLRHPTDAHPPPFGDRVTAVTPEGLVIEPTRGQPQLVAREQVRSLSRYNHARGAKDGALGAGFAGFVIGAAFGLLVASLRTGCSDDCASQRPNAGLIGFEAGAIFGLIGVALGAGIGALGGHEDRFEIER